MICSVRVNLSLLPPKYLQHIHAFTYVHKCSYTLHMLLFSLEFLSRNDKKGESRNRKKKYLYVSSTSTNSNSLNHQGTNFKGKILNCRKNILNLPKSFTLRQSRTHTIGRSHSPLSLGLGLGLGNKRSNLTILLKN
jgi:hypothetical protein